MGQLLKLRDNIAQADYTLVAKDVVAVLLQHANFLTNHHRRGDAFVDELRNALNDFEDASQAARVEQSEADDALGERTRTYDEARQYIRSVKARVRLYASEEGRDNPAVARALLRDYHIRGNQRSLARNSHVVDTLQAIVVAHQAHGDMMRAWGNSDAFLQRAQGLLDTLETVTRDLTVERSEAEHARAARIDAQRHLTQRVNTALTLVNIHTDLGDPTFDDLASAIDKHRALLLGRPEDPAEPAEPDSDALVDILLDDDDPA